MIAVAALRGGGEFGKAWHDAGRLGHKQNVFDDFIAAAEYLKAQGITGPDQLAIEGRSNGGLLVGAVLNQRPDLFAAALPSVGVMDMLRFTHFTAGRYWVDDYGDPDRKADFRNLLAYSPYHNVQGGESYPAILVTTADSDDRVVPAHSFKYVAALQHCRYRRAPASHPHRNRRGPWPRHAGRQADRRGVRQLQLRRLLDGPQDRSQVTTGGYGRTFTDRLWGGASFPWKFNGAPSYRRLATRR